MSARYRCNQCLHEFTVSEDMGSQSCPYCGSFELTEKAGGIRLDSGKLKKIIIPALILMVIVVIILILPKGKVVINDVKYDNARSRITVSATPSKPGGQLDYSFDNGKTWQTSRTFEVQAPGTYIIVVKDDRNKTAAWGIPISVSPDDLREVVDPLTCLPPQIVGVEIDSETTRGSNDGQIKIHTFNGCRPLEFSINNGVSWIRDSVFIDLQPGKYLAVVKDSLTRTASWPDTITIESGPPIIDTVDPPTEQELETRINELFIDPDNPQLLDSVYVLFTSKTMNVECELIGIAPSTPYQLFQFLERRFDGKPGSKRIEVIAIETTGSRISRLKVKEVPVR